MIIHLYIRRKQDIIRYNTFFSVWLRTSSNPADINRFQSHTPKKTYRMTTSPLFIIVYEYVVPGYCAHVEGVQYGEDPTDGQQQQGDQQDVRTSTTPTTAPKH